MEKIRKNSKPVWNEIKSNCCVKCGKMFYDGEAILSGIYCNQCGISKEKEIEIDPDHEAYWFEYHSVCVKCAKPFEIEDQSLFGLYCKFCGKKWEKERKLRQARLKKARGL
ncbi:MAG: hypothetical protein JW776_07700 [Candidatus Lokiarchaeota archaeon]|nr:hypothetical protein [Candidatus Lokiarchaeota archaeon]